MSDHNDLLRMMGLTPDEEETSQEKSMPTPLKQHAHVAHLRELMREYRTHPRDPLEVGDLVVYKPGMAVTHTPGPGRPAILVDVFPDTRGIHMDAPVHSAYGAEMYNCTLAVTVEEHPDTLVFFYGNTARLTKYVAPFDNDEE